MASSYYNDSKATNVDATLKALDAFPGNLLIILGGKDKGGDFTLLRDAVEETREAGAADRRSRGKNRDANCRIGSG